MNQPTSKRNEAFSAAVLVFALFGLVAVGCGGEDVGEDYLVDMPGTDSMSGPTDQLPGFQSKNSYRRDVNPSSVPCPGYTLIAMQTPHIQDARTTLLDMDGKIVRQWNSIGFPAQMLPGGSMVGLKRFRGDSLGDYQEAVELVVQDWAGKETWSFSSWDADGTGEMMSRQHHDQQLEGSPVGYYAPGQTPVEGGTKLVLSHRTVKAPKISDLPLTDDVIYEVRDNGSMGSFIWKASEHVDEMGFDAMARADIKDNPNYMDSRGTGDWLHVNAMSELGKNRWYDQGDQRFHPRNILISSREASFIAIISRQTGKIVWRLGPNYAPGTPEGEIGPLVGQHHAHMIPFGLPGAGNILVFDNGGLSGYGNKNLRSYSRVMEIDPTTLQVVWQYDRKTTGGFLSIGMGGAQRLPNGNTLITNAFLSTVFEVSPAGTMLWTYTWTNPQHFIYRAYRVPANWLPDAELANRYPAWDKLGD